MLLENSRIIHVVYRIVQFPVELSVVAWLKQVQYPPIELLRFRSDLYFGTFLL